MVAAGRRWQEWTSFALGLCLAVSPWVTDYADHAAATANAVFLGLALALSSHFQAALDCCEGEWFHLAGAVWLIVAPFYLGYEHALATATSVCIGAFVAALAGSALSLSRQAH